MSSSPPLRDLFLVPEIQDGIFRYGGLEPNDLAKAALVNQAWNGMVSPYLWENVTMKTIRSHEEDFESGIHFNCQWIRTIKVFHPQVLDWMIESKQCTGLKSLDFSHQSIHGLITNRIHQLIENNPKLTKLRCHANHSHYSIAKFSVLVPGLLSLDRTVGLKSLDFRGAILKAGEDDDSFLKVLNRHCETIEVLKIWECKMESKWFAKTTPGGGNRDEDVGKGQLLRLKKLQSLVWQEHEVRSLNTSYSFDDFCELIKATSDQGHGRCLNSCGSKCGQSEGLRGLQVINGSPEFTTQFPAVLREHLDRLEELSLNLLIGASVGEASSADLLRSLPTTLSFLHLKGVLFGLESNLVLQGSIPAYKTLTVVLFDNCDGLLSGTWQVILESCRLLQIANGDESAPIFVEHIRRPWGCLGLKRFRLRLKITSSLNELGNPVEEEFDLEQEMDNHRARVLKGCKTVFEQLSRLTELSTVDIEITSEHIRGLVHSHLTTTSDDESDEEGEILYNERAVMQHQEFLESFSLLQTCSGMNFLRVHFRLPTYCQSLFDPVILKKKGKEIWGHNEIWIKDTWE